MTVFLVVFGLAWLLCSVFVYGSVLGDLDTEFPQYAWTRRSVMSEHQFSALVFALGGPLALLAGIGAFMSSGRAFKLMPLTREECKAAFKKEYPILYADRWGDD